MKLKLGYPPPLDELGVLARYQQDNPMERLRSVIGMAELFELQALARSTLIAEPVRHYLLAVIRATREHPDIRLGDSTRSALGLQAVSQAMAASRGRDFVMPDDIKALAVPVLSHPITLKTEARLKGRTAKDLPWEILDTVPFPAEKRRLC